MATFLSDRQIERLELELTHRTVLITLGPDGAEVPAKVLSVAISGERVEGGIETASPRPVSLLVLTPDGEVIQVSAFAILPSMGVVDLVLDKQLSEASGSSLVGCTIYEFRDLLDAVRARREQVTTKG